MPFVVMKFGGTSVGTTEAIVRSANLVRRSAKHDRVVVVVSALSGVTDTIIASLQAAKSGDTAKANAICDELRIRHRRVIDELFPREQPAEVNTAVENTIARL